MLKPRKRDIQNVFVLSTGRTGTTYLTSYLQKNCPQVTCVQEPFPGWFFQIMSHRSAVNRLSSPWREITASAFRAAYNHSLAQIPTRIRVEVNPFLYGLAPTLKSVLGPFRILHMVRHPFGFIRSMLNFRPGGFKNLLFHSRFWNPPLAKVYGYSAKNWASLSFFERTAWLWHFENQAIAEAKPLCENYQLLRFEDFTSSSPTIQKLALEQISTGLGLKALLPHPAGDASLVRNASSERNPSETGIPASMLPSISKICGLLMREWGYQADGTTKPLDLTLSA